MSVTTWRALRAAANRRQQVKTRFYNYGIGTREDVKAAEDEYQAARDAHAADSGRRA